MHTHASTLRGSLREHDYLRRGADGPLVSVIVPVCNGARTIKRTLQSVSAQTYANLEVIVVDDGSVDETVSVVREHIALDARVTLMHQAHSGVARARNTGLEHCRGDFVAPIDADDLWHPTRIAKHMRLMNASSEQVAVVYSSCRWIDEFDHVLGTQRDYGCSGSVLLQHIYGNFVGNGSGLLLRKAAALSVGGYDPSLREHGIEGCEDYLLQLSLARHYRFGVVPEYLIGYRVRGPRMSSDHARMVRSQRYVLDSIKRACPYLPDAPFDLLALKSTPTRAAALKQHVARLVGKHRTFSTLLYGARLGGKLKNSLETGFATDQLTSLNGSRHFMDYAPDKPNCSGTLYDLFAFRYLASLDANLAQASAREAFAIENVNQE